MRNGSRSVDAHEKTVKLDPNYHDAYLSLGMYDTSSAACRSCTKRWRPSLGLAETNNAHCRLKGVVEKETGHGRRRPRLLLAIYQNEKRYEDALALLDQLSAKYQRSYLIKLERAYTLVSLKRSDDAYAAFEDLLKDPAAAPAVDLVHYQYAEALALGHDYKRAAEHFLEVPKSKGADANLATLCCPQNRPDLRSGRAARRRGRAIQGVLARPTFTTRANRRRRVEAAF